MAKFNIIKSWEKIGRQSFFGMPLFIWLILFSIFDPTFGGICAIAGFWLGWKELTHSQ